ncbi:hypothetical protein [Hymenobacter glacieicola]|uniref:Uncharacterized protein n=1 Tax=Hymenobacter glacieicola TaxID=1562124 RepID=A0ABQ1X844_9BACT|nr:hypothetical protein [Hymenobacter glacieicola]GGG60663.1 hypothetical protein GCM10011378_40850 [Hymenobacter glacieicola]
MPPKKNPPADPPNVARLPPDQQIAYLVRQHEEFSDWRIKVDERLDKTETAVDELTTSVGEMRKEVRESHITGRESNVTLGEIKLFLTGQRTPGLERPGLSDDFKTMQDKCKSLEEKHAEWEKKFNKYFWWATGFLAASGGAGFFGGKALSQFLDLLK